MEDLISRQAVLDIFGDVHPMDYNAMAYLKQIKELPSVQPKPAECEDAISRKDTCTAIIKRLGIKDETFLLEAERAIYQQILAMPPVQPIIPKGEWEEWIDRNDYNDYESEWYLCNKCHHIQYAATNFCSNCGANMNGK